MTGEQTDEGQPATPALDVDDDYEVCVEFGPGYYSARGPGEKIGYSVFLSICDISEGGTIAFSPDKAQALAQLDLLIGKLQDARRRLVELP